MTVVVDASVALKWVVQEKGSEAADALLDHALIAPDLLLIEAANALWKKAARGELDAEQALTRLARLREAPVAWVATADLLPEACRWATALGHPVYDCAYLALAARENAPLVTDDRRLHAVAQRAAWTAPDVQLLGT